MGAYKYRAPFHQVTNTKIFSLFYLGLLNENENKFMERIFQHAIAVANEGPKDAIKLNGLTANIRTGDPFDTSKKLCNMIGVRNFLKYSHYIYNLNKT